MYRCWLPIRPIAPQAVYWPADAFLFGRRTYEIVGGSSGAVEDPSIHPIAADLRARPGGELQVHGSGALIRWLLDNQFVDEITLFVCPVVIG